MSKKNYRGKFTPRDRSGKPIRNYRARTDFVIPGVPLGVKVLDNDVERSLKIWKRQLKDSGKIMELKQRRYFEKPSSKRRKERDFAIRRDWIENLKRRQNEKECWTIITPKGAM
tara:strand:+ start:98 stop:439 length:342 start_codon:yes stop_codon:yes gene_type:complete